ncbi:uncharacterized protein LOC105666080 [Bombus terrestris]|uniref:Uncharacterized protein LOC105666080 n=1 Tax=Bombus terrestris TaxID=30195 RepID=A0A9B7CWP7_BOMTE|nr:uncharacterized protein LOC105666080 [Bombus terrestris]
MKILVIHIPMVLLIIGFCSSNVAGKPLTSEADDDQEYESTASSPLEDIDDAVSKKSDSKDEENQSDDLPILPPIILLDFGNDTEDGNVTSEEKSKRTVNSGLGYGLNTNSIQMRKYNYYFPAGKSGTTVSIEESISPFLPKTIIERVQPSNQKGHFSTQQNSFATSFSEINSQSQANLRYLNFHRTMKPESVFGLRTKPQKAAASSSSESHRNFFTTSKPPVSSFAIQNSGYRNNNLPTTTQSPLPVGVTETLKYVTPGAANFASSQSDSFNYVTVDPFSHNGNAQTYTSQKQNIQSNINSHSFGSVSQNIGSSTIAPLNYDPHFPMVGSPHSNSPKYTMENGIRYENKVFWKYPDGRVSDVPPSTYVEYSHPLGQQPTKTQEPYSIYENSSTENNILSQGPVQFPTVSEQTGREPNPFVSAESLSASLPLQQVYRLGYQNLVSQRQNVNLGQQRQPNGNLANTYSFPPVSSTSREKMKPSLTRPKINYSSRNQQTLSRYMVNSPNPEYTTEPTINGTTPVNSFFSSSTVHSSRTTPKYNPKIQNYLDTILAENRESQKQSFSNNDLNDYSNLQYSDLLNYNPSISEYIRNPSSILNVRPTFVQAGNSLIPVIILRVDGASPIQTKDTQNINLKALLQQYLLQYAKSIQQLAQPSTYNLGSESFSKHSTIGTNKSPVLDLIRLTQDDAQSPTYSSNSYVGKSSYEASNLDDSNSRYVQGSSGRQKTKSVQILEDPRYTNYKVNN